MGPGTKWAKRYRKPSSIQKNNQKVVTSEMSLLEISVLFKKIGRWRIFPVQKLVNTIALAI